MEFKRVTLPAQHYFYVEKTVPVTAEGISQAMGDGFGTVFGFTETKGVERLSVPSAIYLDMPSPEGMTFRTAIFVRPEEAFKAETPVGAGILPAGEAIMATHIGPYANMNQSHQALWAHMADNSIPAAMPIWEVYLDDPTAVPEDECRTEIYRMIGT